MSKIGKPTTAFLLMLACSGVLSAAFAEGETTLQMIKRVERLRSEAFSAQKNGDSAHALALLEEASDAVLDDKYRDPNKAFVINTMTAQLTAIQGSAFQKRDWRTSEAALRKKISFMEKTNQADSNDYQSALRFLDITLRAQKKSTETTTLQAKMKPLNAEEKHHNVMPVAFKKDAEDKEAEKKSQAKGQNKGR
ncbi:MAG: hypothetical protein K2W82_19710 [Candidatus Obscuribacterales bacterium]|nr:hypothetical protein [Candidatus Obscuribacterales bacterium]